MQVIESYITEVILYNSIEEYVGDKDRRLKNGYLEMTKTLNSDATIIGVYAINRKTMDIRSYLILCNSNKQLIVRDDKRIIYTGTTRDLLMSTQLDNIRLRERVFKSAVDGEQLLEINLL